MRLERPVAAPGGGAGEVGRGGDVGTGGGREGVERGGAVAALRKVAAIDQDVAAGFERPADLRELAGEAAGDRGLVDARGAEIEGAFLAMADDMDRGDPGLGGEHGLDLCQTVALVVDQHDLAARRPFGGELLIVGHRGVDEDDLVAGGGRRGGRGRRRTVGNAAVRGTGGRGCRWGAMRGRGGRVGEMVARLDGMAARQHRLGGRGERGVEHHTRLERQQVGATRRRQSRVPPCCHRIFPLD